VISRQVLVPTAPTHLAIVITTQPPVPFKLQLLKAPTGSEVSWTESRDYPVHLEKSAPDGLLSIYNTTLPPGKYLTNLMLAGEGSLEGYQPSPIDGALSGGAGKTIQWRAVYIPSTDDKVCPIVPDESQQRYFKAMFESWASGTGTTAAAAAVPPPKGKGAAAAGGGGPRAQLAAAALEKLEAASAPRDESGDAEPVASMSRTLKDGSNLALDPEARVSILTAPTSLPVVLSKEQLEERAAAAAAAIAESSAAAPGPGPLAANLEQGKGARSSLATRRASEFSEWRTHSTAGAKAALKARAIAMLRVQQKEQEEEARLAAMTEVSS